MPRAALVATALLLLPLAPLAAAEDGLDLVATSVNAPENTVAGQRAQVSGWFEAQGSGCVEVLAGFLVDDVLVQMNATWVCGNGWAYVAAYLEMPAAGNHTLAFVADVNDALAETNESNNAVNASFRTAPEPYLDAAVLDVRVPGYVAAGESFSIDATVAFTGTPLDGDAHWFGEAYLDGEQVGWGVYFFSDGDRTTSVSITVENVTAGWHWVEFVVDTEQWHDETDEWNNVGWAGLYVHEARPDLAVRILPVEREAVRTDLGPVAPNPWTRVIRVEVCNEGAGVASWGHLSIRAEGRTTAGLADMRVGDNYVDELSPGACEVFSWRWWGYNGLGDYRVLADVEAWGDANQENDHDAESDFVVVGGLNAGVVAWV